MPTLALKGLSGLSALCGPTQAIYLHDTFTDANGTALADHTPDAGGPWTEHAGSTDIQSNRARIVSACTATVPTSSNNITATVTVNPAASGSLGLSLRFTDTDHLWWITVDDAANQLRITERNGSNTVRASAAKTITPGTDYTITATLQAQSIAAELDTGESCTYAGAALNQTAKTHGIRGAVAGSTWDNITIQTL